MDYFEVIEDDGTVWECEGMVYLPFFGEEDNAQIQFPSHIPHDQITQDKIMNALDHAV